MTPHPKCPSSPYSISLHLHPLVYQTGYFVSSPLPCHIHHSNSLTHAILRRTPGRPTHIQQNIQHIHAPHIRPHSRLINLRTPLVQQRIQRKRQPILILSRTPRGSAICPLAPVRVVCVVVGVVASGVEVSVITWRRHDGYRVRVGVVRLGGDAPERGG